MLVKKKKRMFLVSLSLATFLFFVVAQVFSQTSAPAIDSFTPNPIINTIGANPGAIVGSNFVELNAGIGTHVYVSGTLWPHVFVDSGTLQINLPAGNPMDPPTLYVGPLDIWVVTIDSSGGSTPSNVFTASVVYPSPSIDSISPTQFFNNQLTIVDIFGSGFTASSTLDVLDTAGNFLFTNPHGAGVFFVVDTNTATLTVPVGFTSGSYLLRVSNPGASGANNIQLDVLNAAPPSEPSSLVANLN